MFRISYGRFNNVYSGDYDYLSAMILAARENGGLVEEWDARSEIWREI